MKILHLETQTGEPIQAGENTITLVSQSVRLQPPGFPGGLIWNRPVAVRVQTGSEPEKTLPVRDVTRLAQLLVVGLGLVGGLFTILAWKMTSKERK